MLLLAIGAGGASIMGNIQSIHEAFTKAVTRLDLPGYTADTSDNAGVLNFFVRKYEFGANATNVFKLNQRNHI